MEILFPNLEIKRANSQRSPLIGSRILRSVIVSVVSSTYVKRSKTAPAGNGMHSDGRAVR